MATLFQGVLESDACGLSFRNGAKFAAIVQGEASAHSRNHNLLCSLECHFPSRDRTTAWTDQTRGGANRDVAGCRFREAHRSSVNQYLDFVPIVLQLGGTAG